MLRLSTRRLLFDKLASTKLGAEVLAQTRTDMQQLNQSESYVLRFFSRRRPIDFLAIEVDGPITKELHPSFRYVKNGLTFLVFAPIFVLLVAGVLQPTYYMLVPTHIISAEKYNGMWQFSHWALVLAGQLLFFVILYDLSVYVRYPFFAYGLAPAYRKLHLVRPTPVAFHGVEELKGLSTAKRHVAAKPLGRPLGEVRKEVKKEPRPNPFGGKAK